MQKNEKNSHKKTSFDDSNEARNLIIITYKYITFFTALINLGRYFSTLSAPNLEISVSLPDSFSGFHTKSK